MNGQRIAFFGEGSQQGERHMVLRMYGDPANQAMAVAAASPDKNDLN